jgi:hypothetical protein
VSYALLPNPHLLEQRFWTLPTSCFHGDTTHAAVNLAGREVRILKRLLCFKRVNRAHRCSAALLEHKEQFNNSYIIDNKQLRWYPERDLNSGTPLKTNKLLKTMQATNAENCRYAVIWYVLGTRPFVLNLL